MTIESGFVGQRRSRAWRARADKVLTCGAMTLSKAPERFPESYPQFLERAAGCRIWDVDCYEYTDYMQALGPIILGHDFPAVSEAICDQVQDGILFSLEHLLVVEVAELLCELVPCAERVRFLKSGTAANEAALRLTRTYTGRDVVVFADNSYHGWHDAFQVTQTGRGPAGVPKIMAELTAQFRWNDIGSLEKVLENQHPGNVACVFIEPARTFEPAPGFLAAVKELCRRYGVLLVFDEVVTGFRMAVGGAQQYYGVTPDLATVGKAIANGMPLATVVGRDDVMQAFDRCFVSGTYAGECLSLAAAKATLQVLRDEPVIEHLWRQGKRLRAAFDTAAKREQVDARSVGTDVCSAQVFAGDTDQVLKSLWLQETAARGVLFGHIQYISYAHEDEDLDETESVIDEAMAVVGEAVRAGNAEQLLHGRPIGGATNWPLQKERGDA